MKKKDIVNLIRYHIEKNDAGFRSVACDIAHEFESTGDMQLSSYVMALVSSVDTFMPQSESEEIPFLEKCQAGSGMLLLPDLITRDMLGVVHAVKHRVGINKFLFKGDPGTGKTEAAKQLAAILGRELFIVDTAALIDSKLGQTQKNIAALFKSINLLAYPEKHLILFDEIDTIALDRTNTNDLREMGRATSAILRGFDSLDENVVIVATTNLFHFFDKALLRRFDFVVDFDRYTREDLASIAEKMLNKFLDKFKLANRDVRLFRKVIGLLDPMPHPGDLANIIKTAVAFSDPEDGLDYFCRLFAAVSKNGTYDVRQLQEKGFTVREIGILLHKSKSGVARELQAEEGR